ncbi:MAG TPA: nitroreductase [Cryomorphaceae bacterium]|nr:nitroreductase [Owenweeksia sp.]HAD97399.1 nitroreductase [Cryomorphaceae bacterium]HBF18957.1 nitroreductase [Cryomorphaceae bacterium]HCQ15642.1 nitroreductase [Cryomorphaceae bacterium]|tara:strand:+ start:36 stop:644 length:609 start_codon:yes stop_codon:yes gene_type:complete
MLEQKKAQTEHELIPEIMNRWSPRAFADREVEVEKLQRIFEAARWAPSSTNEQPWRFIVASKGDEHYDKLYGCLNEWNRKWTWTAPVLVATLAKKNFTKNDKPNKHSWHDLGLAMGNLSAQATHENLYLHQMAGIHTEEVERLFEVDTDAYEVVSMFVLGYQDEKRLQELEERYHESELKERSRKPLNELVFGKRFGEAVKW